MIEGVSLVELRQIADERGAVLHMLRNDAADFTQFGECYFSEVLPGATKGWKRHRLQTQNLAVPVGRVRFMIYDDRAGSASRGESQVIELGRPDAYRRLRIAPGLWCAFTSVSAGPALVVNCSDLPHDPAESETRPLSDPSLPRTWP